MSFAETQVRALSAKLSPKHVRTRQANGLTLSYIEGWRAIAEANRIFGFDAWDRQTMANKCVWEGPWQGRHACSYVARVRVRVRAGDVVICREGCGSGHGKGVTPGEAHESALKEAETDAMKRALATFGNPFGLALYDKEQHGVRGARGRKREKPNGQAITWIVLSAEGEVISVHEDPVDYCKAIRQVLEAGSTPERLKSFWNRNAVTTQMLCANLPDLKTDAGEHYADILAALYKRQLKVLHEEAKTDQTQKEATSGSDRTKSTDRVDKSVLAIGTPRRVRDKDHLRAVASQPCLVCGRSPGHAHHLRFAQPRALGRKVSDEWVVPLCATHHRALHTVGDEEKWWKGRQIDPIVHATQLWRQRRDDGTSWAPTARELIRPTPS